MNLAKEVMKSSPEFINNLSAVMLNNLKLAREYVPRLVDVDLVYFHATEVTGKLDGILNRNPLAWQSFFSRKIEVHGLACHHELVLDPGPAAQIGKVLQRRLGFLNDQPTDRTLLPIHKQLQTATPIYV
jgi:enterobactin synthetase component F